jgi:Protein of unknown function (DUF3460)
MKFSKQIYGYQSDITKFVEELKEKNPKLEAEQLAGRALLWDKTPIDLDSQNRTQESRVDQQPYVYQNNH